MPESPTVPAELPGRKVSRSLLADQVTDAIREAIISGSLPPGARLSVPEMARRFGVSRTPARESLLVLEREGLVRQRENSGMEVLYGSARDMREMLEVREGLEAMAVRLAAERMGEADQARLRAALDQHRAALAEGKLAGHADLDSAFHAIIHAATDNSELRRLLTELDHRVRVVNHALSHSVDFDPDATIRDHDRIADAIIARDPATAERAMCRHVRRVRSYYERLERIARPG